MVVCFDIHIYFNLDSLLCISLQAALLHLNTTTTHTHMKMMKHQQQQLLVLLSCWLLYSSSWTSVAVTSVVVAWNTPVVPTMAPIQRPPHRYTSSPRTTFTTRTTKTTLWLSQTDSTTPSNDDDDEAATTTTTTAATTTAAAVSSPELSAFDTYRPGSTTNIVWKDIVIGTNDDNGEMGAKDQDVVVVSYVGTILNTGQKFITNTEFVFQLGSGQSLPGFEQGLLGVHAGTTRRLRVPPNKAYGTRGTIDGKIPPNADLEFDVEVKRVVSYEKSPLLAQLALFGELRLLGLLGCVGVLALPPLFSN
jgi:FKBP-type peptidyl-prolyl cis-trans isomerase